MFFDNPSRILKIHSDIATVAGALHECRYIFLIVSVSVLLGLRKFSNIFMEKLKTHNLISINILRKLYGL